MIRYLSGLLVCGLGLLGGGWLIVVIVLLRGTPTTASLASLGTGAGIALVSAVGIACWLASWRQRMRQDGVLASGPRPAGDGMPGGTVRRNRRALRKDMRHAARMARRGARLDELAWRDATARRAEAPGPDEVTRLDVVPGPGEETRLDVVPGRGEETQRDVVPGPGEVTPPDLVPGRGEETRRDVVPGRGEVPRRDVVAGRAGAAGRDELGRGDARQPVIPGPRIPLAAEAGRGGAAEAAGQGRPGVVLTELRALLEPLLTTGPASVADGEPDDPAAGDLLGEEESW